MIHPPGEKTAEERLRYAVQIAYNALNNISQDGPRFADETERRLYASTARNFMADAAREGGYDPLKGGL